MSKYEAHIDGLRGIAITSVLLFHCGYAFAANGYLGVDIFFVISGYLITGLLISEAERTGTIWLKNFYLRRARRLLPNLFTLLLVTALAAPFFLNKDEVAQLGKSLIATTVYISNVFFYRQSGYFSPAAEEMPLLHTWSLAVEEQFYFVWPAIILACFALWRTRAKQKALLVVLALGVASAILFAVLDAWAPDAAFYLAPTRVWQFAAGALLAMARSQPALRDFSDGQSIFRKIAVACAVLVLVWTVSVGSGTEHASILDPVLAVVGTVVLLACCRNSGSGVVSKVLQSSFANFLGRTSYSVYLWHWPAIVFYRYGNPGPISSFDRIACLALSLVLGVGAYYAVENPIRQGKKLPFLGIPKNALVFFGVTSALLVSVGVSLWRIGPTTYSGASESWYSTAINDVNPLRKTCLVMNGSWSIPTFSQCSVGGNQVAAPLIAVWGDSHADAFFPGIRSAMPRNFAAFEMTKSGCPPMSGMTIRLHGRLVPECREFNDAALQKIVALSKERRVIVVLSARWAFYLLGDPRKVEGGGNSEQDLARALGAALSSLEQANIPAIVVGSVPEYRFDLPRCLARVAHFSRAVDSCGQLVGEALERIDPTILFLNDAITRAPRTVLFRPDKVLCRTGSCIVQNAQHGILYSDGDHLTTRGASLVADELFADPRVRRLFITNENPVSASLLQRKRHNWQ